EDCLEREGYTYYVDLFAEHSPYSLLTTSFRLNQREVAEPEIHDRIKEAVAYAHERGFQVALDVDVRLARAAFREAYPDELQEMLRLRTAELVASGEVEVAIGPEELRDHMTGNTIPYVPVAGRFVRAYSYVVGAEGIEPESVQEITAERCTVKAATEKEVRVAIACDATCEGRTVCVMAAFTHLTPAVYAPHLLEFQRAIAAQYADVPLAGLMKDEWGFPPCHGGCPAKNDFWFSPWRAEAYAEATGGRDLVRDCLLMHAGERGRTRERQAAINRLLEMSRVRNAAIEDDFYRVAKELFGPDAYVTTHATWVPYPGVSEFKKNGLDWWAATRDLAQTDEVAPYCARTALAKKWGSGVWYNQYYAPEVAAYERELWAHAAGGGRINYHPLYPKPDIPRRNRVALLLTGGLMRGECRVRLLSLVSQSAIDCPVAVVFGQACAMNWAGPAYDDVGLAVTDALWRAGYYADLIPSTELTDKAFQPDVDGRVRYGAQPYAAVVLYHPEFERPGTADVFRAAAAGGTALFRVGDWTMDFDANPLDGNAALPEGMVACENTKDCVARVIAALEARGIRPCTPATSATPAGGRMGTAAPGRKGQYRLLDGTEVVVAGENDVAGDPIVATLDVNGREAAVDAIGVAAVRLGEGGRLDALAAGGLKSFRTGDVHIELDERVDIALWRDGAGALHGVLQGWDGPVPAPLAALCADWTRLPMPPPAPMPE
ncbi:MAG: hypothetical protein JXR94_17060, partial [Candidatus Hydrogenedentes bacterium]|nr:hypothetical protein [Candidatus Hydrogenedentota bacterium]